MSRKISIPAVAVLSIVGSIVVFFMTTVLMNSISNYEASEGLLSFLNSIPCVMIAIAFEVGIFYFLRAEMYKNNLKKLTKIYGIFFMVLGVIALVTVILSYFVLYGGVIKKSAKLLIFFHVLILIISLLLIILGALMTFVFQRHIEVKGPTHKVSARYVFETIGLSFGVYFILFRLGGLFLSPMFIDHRNLTDTYIFLISVVLLGLFYLHFVLETYGFYKNRKASRFYIPIVLTSMSVLVYLQIGLTMYNNQGFLSAISLFNPIGRLLKFPYESVFQFVANFGMGIIGITTGILAYKRKEA